MKAYLRSVRIAPKKLNLIAKMVRGMSVPEALEALAHTHKKGARIVQGLLQSAVANARHNDKQHPELLVIKTIVVNQGTGYHRGIPKARGSVRPITKFLSHVALTLGVASLQGGTQPRKAENTSQKPKNAVQGKQRKKHTDSSSDSPAPRSSAKRSKAETVSSPSS